MSLLELTRNSFQSGISAPKWLSLCKLLISKDGITYNAENVEKTLSNAVLSLFRSYPGDHDLQEYLKFSLQQGTISVAVFVSSMLQAVRSPELHSPTTLQMLCSVALNAHKASGLPALGSIISSSESPVSILNIVQDALAFLRISHSFPTSHLYKIADSSSELVSLVLSCVTDLSQIPSAQAMISYADVNDLMHNFRLSPELRQALDDFAISLSYVIGDEAKAAREAQTIQTIQFSLSKGDILGPSSESDIVTLSLVLHHLVSRGGLYCGSESDAVALLVGVFRWSSWSPAVFYTQLFFTSFLCLSQNPHRYLLWHAFIVGRLPLLIRSFESVVKGDGSVDLDWSASLQTAVLSLFRRTDILNACDVILARNSEDASPLTRELLRHLISLDLIDVGFTAQVDASISNDGPTRLQSECQDSNLDLPSYLDLKLTSDLSLDDCRVWIDRIVRDPNAHNAFASFLLKRFVSLASTLEVESLSVICKVLCLNDAILDVVALNTKISDLIYYALVFLERYDCETVGDPQTAYSHLGDIVLFVQYILARFQFSTSTLTMDERSVSSMFLRSADMIYPAEKLTVEETGCFNAWFKALFDSSSEGIEDTILRATQPRMLLRISATLFSQAIRAMLAQKIDADVLSNGVSYFTGPLLNWTLVGVIKALVREIQQKSFATHLEILQTLLLSPSCPRPVLALCSPQIASLLTRVGKASSLPASLDTAVIQRVVAENANVKDLNVASNDSYNMHSWQEYPKYAIQHAFLLAKSQKAPKLDVEKCLTMTSPSKFLHLLWAELVTSASLGELEICKRIATFVLTTPRASEIPPLLPIFVHVVLPSLIGTIDRQQTPEQTVNVELMATVISSVLTSMLHLEWATRSVSGHHRTVLGESSSGVARRLSHYFQRRTHSVVSGMIVQRLVSSQSFIANFPMFLGA